MSYLPWIVTLSLVGVPLLALFKGMSAFKVALFRCALVFGVILLWVFVPGWVLRFRADGGNPEAMYELARWSENHAAKLETVLLWHGKADTDSGFRWLEKAAKAGYPKAVYALGVRLKYNLFVATPVQFEWPDPAENEMPLPSKGQVLINRAQRLGYQPTVDEQHFYWQDFRH